MFSHRYFHYAYSLANAHVEINLNSLYTVLGRVEKAVLSERNSFHLSQSR